LSGNPLFEEDFDQMHKDRFSLLLRERTVEIEEKRWFIFYKEDLIAFELTPLRGADPNQMHRIGGPAGKSQPHRTLHYEQGAIIIADCSRLLIAVMPLEEKPGRVGGTARTLHYRCIGKLPPATNPRFDTLIAPFESALSPLPIFPTDNLDQQRLRRVSSELPDLDEPTEWLSPRVGLACQLVPGPKPEWHYFKGEMPSPPLAMAYEAEVLAPLRAYDNCNRDGLKCDIRFHDIEGFWRKIKDRLAGSDPGELAALVRLYRIRRVIADIQDAAKKKARCAIVWLGWLFVGSVGTFTWFKVGAGWWPGVIYLGLVLAAAMLYGFVRAKRLGEVQEDYRAAAEALRVQVGWRIAGIEDRVERHYVPGSAKQLARVRDGVATVNTVVALEHRAAEIARRVAHVGLAREHWVAEQRDFYSRNATLRSWSNAKYLFLMVLAFGGGLGIFARLTAHFCPALEAGAGPAFVSILLVSLVPFCLRFRNILLKEPNRGASPIIKAIIAARQWLFDRLDRLARRFSAIARRRNLGRGLVLFYPLLWCLLPVALGWWFAVAVLHGAEALDVEFKTVEKGLSILVAVLNGIAGMAVYRREKLTIESEERNYEEMAEVFAAADGLMEACQGDVRNEQIILKELGRAALGENASWLRAHRERPIEQIAGG
jgi:hypothetical protein